MLIRKEILRCFRLARCFDTKNILYGQEGRLRLLRGCDQISNAVKVTMGPKGRVVLIDQVFGNPQITKDGYTVAKAISLEDRIENLGCTITKSAAEKTNFEVGDGTSASVILTHGIFKEGCKVIEGGINPNNLKKGIQLATITIVKELEKMSIKLDPKSKLLERIATIAANGDNNVGGLVAFILQKVGAHGFVNVVRDRKLLETEVVFTKGYRIDQGAASPYFLTDPGERLELKDPFVLIVDDSIQDISDVAKFIEHATKNKRPLFIFARTIETKALTYLIVNNTTKNAQTCVVLYEAGNILGISDDVAALTKSIIINKKKGIPLNKAGISCMGSAQRISVSTNYTVIIRDGKKDKGLEGYIKRIRRAKEDAMHSKELELYTFYGNSLSKLLGESAIVNVGAATEVESSELKDRIDDSIHASQAALKEGIVVGGGAALVHASKVLKELKQNLTYEEKLGVEIVEKVCRTPSIIIAENAGYIGTAIAEYIYRNPDNHFGFDAYNCEMKDLVEAGIIDATKVVKQSLTNAVSVANMLITAESVVAFEHEPQINKVE